jgi:hypothetical protein
VGASCRRWPSDPPREFSGVGSRQPVKDSFGKAVYLAACQALAVSPVAQIVKYLEYGELRLAHYGIGFKGIKALVDALKVRQKSRAESVSGTDGPPRA